jgi:hypothetical protein
MPFSITSYMNLAHPKMGATLLLLAYHNAFFSFCPQQAWNFSQKYGKKYVCIDTNMTNTPRKILHPSVEK